MAGAKATGGGAPLGAASVPWRGKQGQVASVSMTRFVKNKALSSPVAEYAMSVAKHPDPIGSGLAAEALLEAAGPDCLIPGLNPPVRILGVQVWPLVFGNSSFRLKALEPIVKELRTISKLAEKAIDIMNAPLGK